MTARGHSSSDKPATKLVTRGFLLKRQPPPEACDCLPPWTCPGGTTEPVGTVWVCEHRTRAWVAYDPSSARITCMFRRWREIGGRQLRKAVAKIDREGHMLAVRQTWTPRDEPPDLAPPD